MEVPFNVNRIINAIKDCFLFFLDLIQKVFLHYVFDKIFVNRCSAQVSYWSYANCFNNKVSKGSILLLPCKVIVKIWNRGNFCLWNPESGALKFGVQLKVFGIPLIIWIRNQSSVDKECGIWNLQHGIRDPRLCCIALHGARFSYTNSIIRLAHGSYRSFKTWKEMEFKNFIFQAWKVMEFDCRSLKVMEN